MPSIFKVFGYSVFFWSNENNEPIHVHISKGNPIPNATKYWITKNGGCIQANNNSKIPVSDLNELEQIISAQFFVICSAWKENFKTDQIKYYC